MKTFKLIKTVLMAVLLCTNLTSCNDEYDDSEIWNKVNSLDDFIMVDIIGQKQQMELQIGYTIVTVI